ncbi:MAG: SRPBCC domain-containing protein [Acidobacteriota bacterium]|nr:SRPBCC domain-containing protein [Acidobacteriota bacterium]
MNAPRDLVFRMWTEAEHVREWWGPHMFTNPVCEIDARTGGAWRIVMRGPDGSEHECGGTYREVIRDERIVFTNNVVDGKGHIVLEGLTSVTFEDYDGGTRLILVTRAKAIQPAALMMLQGMEPGWMQSIDRFAAFVEKQAAA